MKELNERQIALYNFLKAQGDNWTLQIEVVYGLIEYYPFTDSNDKFHDSTARHTLTADIRALNNSDAIQKVIISSGKGVKIATEEEWQAAIKREYISTFKKLKRIRQKERKGNMNGQLYMLYETEQDIIQAFLNEA